ncbi:MAG: AAA family ATPase [Terracidiphilus sp.]|jgi:predicted ATPase
MTNNSNKTRPVRTLTVKNFSVIEDAKLEFGKITVLIGPQASGKSLLCKLAYFLSKQAIENALVAILSQRSADQSTFDEFKSSLSRDFLAWFPLETWHSEGATVTFESQAFRVRVFATKQLDGVGLEFSPDFETLFDSLVNQVQRVPAAGADSRRYIADQVSAQFYLLLTGTFVDRPVYIPDGRAFFTNQTLGFSLVNNPDIHPILKEFSLEVSWGGAPSINHVLGEEGVRILHEIRSEIIRIAGGGVEGRNGSARFRRILDGKSIPLPLLSSGTQTLLPMFNLLWRVITEQRGRILFPRPDNLSGMPNQIIESLGLVYVEEPEANIFPSTQYDLIRLFAWLSREWRLDFSWVITTHSPYVLSSFNNLIFAGQLGRDKRLKKKIKIDARFWIEPETFKAYSIHDGKLESILSDTGLINGEYLDSVSETIGNEFDEMLRLEYGTKKAS